MAVGTAVALPVVHPPAPAFVHAAVAAGNAPPRRSQPAQFAFLGLTRPGCPSQGPFNSSSRQGCLTNNPSGPSQGFAEPTEDNTMQFEHMVLTGPTIRRLMRQHRVTLRQIKAQHQVTLKRTREVRLKGVRGFMAANWFWIITGRWPDEPKPEAPTIVPTAQTCAALAPPAHSARPKNPAREIGGAAPTRAPHQPDAPPAGRPSTAAVA